ncbi:hypothetical protein F0M18_01180 [Pseudohalioglobus sediminis]|uniref:Bacterial repeat domain-containing protein n=1 Tax=Pseudohalioglobus sediminis TaxID=2606449 RepID=A0A5B0X452_9GAMM|nr:hypothetical protein [Pseudohalioglobus sediminis]KAA1194086.1 hypothetical protein F0M18_01180 [Pseudohalioglobus sediminis]
MLGLRLICIALISLAVCACKVEIIVPEGGRVLTESGAYNCSEGKTCTIDVVDIFFDEVFQALPEEGYLFEGWKKRDNGFCGGKDEACSLSTKDFAGNDLLLAILESDETFFLQPVFSRVDAIRSQARKLYISDGISGIIVDTNKWIETDTFGFNVNYADWVYLDGSLYGIRSSGTVYKINPLTGDVAVVGSSGLSTGSTERFHMFSANGKMYILIESFIQSTHKIFKVNLETGFASFHSDLNGKSFEAISSRADTRGLVYAVSDGDNDSYWVNGLDIESKVTKSWLQIDNPAGYDLRHIAITKNGLFGITSGGTITRFDFEAGELRGLAALDNSIAVSFGVATGP